MPQNLAVPRKRKASSAAVGVSPRVKKAKPDKSAVDIKADQAQVKADSKVKSLPATPKKVMPRPQADEFYIPTKALMIAPITAAFRAKILEVTQQSGAATTFLRVLYKQQNATAFIEECGIQDQFRDDRETAKEWIPSAPEKPKKQEKGSKSSKTGAVAGGEEGAEEKEQGDGEGEEEGQEEEEEADEEADEEDQESDEETKSGEDALYLSMSPKQFYGLLMGDIHPDLTRAQIWRQGRFIHTIAGLDGAALHTFINGDGHKEFEAVLAHYKAVAHPSYAVMMKEREDENNTLFGLLTAGLMLLGKCLEMTSYGI